MNLANECLRCDGCGRKSEPFDKWTPFMMPPSINKFTNLPDGKFPGITRAKDPKKAPVILHACPGCEPKIKLAIQTSDFETYCPDGPLKKVLRSILTKKMMSNLRLQ